MRTAHRKAARHKREQRDAYDVPLIGFGLTFDIAQGRARNWYQDAGGVKRWADNDEPIEDERTAEMEQQ
ncbi:MAG: hypothetical protein Q4A28_06400 [Brachymonas sp.]|nr:hypothetical protein [Brachymonas sp.]